MRFLGTKSQVAAFFFGISVLAGACSTAKKSSPAPAPESAPAPNQGTVTPQPAPAPGPQPGVTPQPGPSPTPGPVTPLPGPGPSPVPSPSPSPTPTPAPSPSPTPSPYGQAVDATAPSVQANLMNAYCVPCHKGANAPEGLDLTNIAQFADGGSHGWRGLGLIVPGDSAGSAIVQIIGAADADTRMPPPDNTLGIPAVSAAQIKGLAAWIDGLPKGSGTGL